MFQYFVSEEKKYNRNTDLLVIRHSEGNTFKFTIKDYLVTKVEFQIVLHNLVQMRLVK